MRRSITALIAALVLVASVAIPALAAKPDAFDSKGNVIHSVSDVGFDQYGYNRVARIFSGPISGWCLAGGDPADCWPAPYSNDHLIMKWNATWDACNASGANDAANCLGAWITNEWNGSVPNGSGEHWLYKIIWVGPGGDSSPYWAPGGYSVWGSYEVIMDQGIDPSWGPGHYFYTRATPNGLG